MQLLRGLCEQLAQRGVGVFAGEQRGGGGQQADVVGGQVAGEVHHAARQRDGAQEGEAAGQGVGLGQVSQGDAWGAQQLLHHG